MSTSRPSTVFTPIDVPVRFPTREVAIGDLRVGGGNPILIQSMTIADTMDTDAVVKEIRALVEAGCPLVRLTAPSQRDAENLREIRKRLHADGIRVPMVADIHFTPNAAMVAAEIVEKVRINPGNYADRKKFKVFEISDADYVAELERIRDRVVPLVRRCKENGVALRIGTNHGSLSDRIMNRYGDTPEGMVESALEFVRICRDEGFHDIVLSMKSSIPTVMIGAYRLLVQRMAREEMDYPLHLGVTEAGNGLEGRTKSTVGIGSLLASGIGDTIRVSLTEDSEHEIGACRNILQGIEAEMRLPDPGGPEAGHAEVAGSPRPSPARWRPAELWRTLPAVSWSMRRRTTPWTLGPVVVGGDAPIRVELRVDPAAEPDVRAVGSRDRDRAPELLSLPVIGDGDEMARVGDEMARVGDEIARVRDRMTRVDEIRRRFALPVLVDWCGTGRGLPSASVVEELCRGADAVGLPAPDPEDIHDDLGQLLAVLARHARPVRWRLRPEVPVGVAKTLAEASRTAGVPGVGFVLTVGPATIARGRALAEVLGGDDALIFLEGPASGSTGALVAGTLLTEGVGDVLCLTEPGTRADATDIAPPWPAGGVAWDTDPVAASYLLLQACRLRLTRAEFIACPSCGRTQFDLQTTTARIRARTEHLSGVKIAIMGCIVNGPGEMADADFGYVGSGSGRVDLYVGKERVARNIPAGEAEDRLVTLLDEHGAWQDPPGDD